MKLPIAGALLASLAACSHAPPPQVEARPWYLNGLDDQKPGDTAPVGPLDSDVQGFEQIKLREGQNQLASAAALQEIDNALGGASQVLASAVALPLFRAGVYLGSPDLISRSCTAARKVTHAALRATGNVDTVFAGCNALGTTRPASDGCGEGAGRLRDAYGLLAGGKARDAGKLAAEAVRVLRDKCPRAGAPQRTPVDPSSRGFLIVWALHAAEAPPSTYLAGEGAPRTSEAINDAFLSGVRALRATASLR